MAPNVPNDVVILGAGIAGLAAAHRLREIGCDPIICEALDHPGGLLAGFSVGEFRFDQAVHLSFATEPEVRRVFDQTPFHTHAPKSFNWDNGFWLRHPAQNNMFPLPADEKLDLIAGLAAAEDGPIDDYRQWLIRQYGEPIANRWPLRYTRKYWRLDASELGVDWVGNRMRRADLNEVVRGATSSTDENTYYVKEMRYPKEGGYAAFIKPLLDGANIRFGFDVSSVSLEDRTVRSKEGDEVPFQHLIATIPLPRLASVCQEVPKELQLAAADLICTEIDLVSVGISKPNIPPSLWFYVYDEDIEAARVYSPSMKSSRNAPSGTSSLQFEIYSLPGEDVNRTREFLFDNCRYALRKMGLCEDKDILFMDHRRATGGNVVFFNGMEAIRDPMISWFEDRGIKLAGRFGRWEYQWSNQAFMSGRNAAEALLSRIIL